MNTLDPSQPLVSAAAAPWTCPPPASPWRRWPSWSGCWRRSRPPGTTRGLAWTLGETSLHLAGGPAFYADYAGGRVLPEPTIDLGPVFAQRMAASPSERPACWPGGWPPTPAVPGRDRRAARHPPGPLLRRGDHRTRRPERHPAGRVRHPRLRRRPLHRAALADRGGPRPPDHRRGHRPVAPLRRPGQRGPAHRHLPGPPARQASRSASTAAPPRWAPHSPGRLTAGSPSTRSPSCWCSMGGARNGRGSSGASCAPAVADPGWARASSACSCGPDQPNPLR